MRILVLGDFYGAARAAPSRPIRVDIDNFDDVLARAAPLLELAALPGQELRIAELDDFHPDRLAERLEAFRSPLELRRKLKDPRSSQEALAAFRAEALGPAPKRQEERPEAAAPEGAGSLFESLIGGRPQGAPPPPEVSSGLDDFIRSVVAPHVVASQDPELPVVLRSVDEALGEKMREVLHAPELQALEAAWRGLRWLVSSEDLADEVSVFLLQLSRDELLSAGGSQEDLARLFESRGLMSDPQEGYALWAGNFVLGADERELRALGSLAGLAARARTRVVVGAAPSVVGCARSQDLANPSAWAESAPPLSSMLAGAGGSALGMVLPRMLARAPYGQRTDPIESFDFEELSASPDEGSLLWGSSALACALVFAREALGLSGRRDPGLIEGLPAVSIEEDGQSRLLPCAEVLLGERAVDALLSKGVMPLASFRDRNAARLIRLQSVVGTALS